MAALPELVWDIPTIDVSHIITEDDTPVDNIASERQMRLLVDPLYAGWEGPSASDGSARTFVAMANVGLFTVPKNTPLVPDVLVSLDVTFADNIWAKENRTYFVWEFGKTPDLVVEVVSNREGGELDRKLRGYERARVGIYVVYDPEHLLSPHTLQCWELKGSTYIPCEPVFRDFKLKLEEWSGTYGGITSTWLRWHRFDGTVLPTGAERAAYEKRRAEAEKQRAEAERDRAESEKQRAEAERDRAESEKQRAEAERERAERMAAKLRELGIDPTKLT
ncbi:MAG: Uma2 family endonuclease [Polyangiaceae bacterium]|nr:Uma2 family endonuclease [Polyangiaceae bacterium]